MPRKLMVYFTNDYRAQFDADKVVFVSDPFATMNETLVQSHIEEGRSVVNWDNVCFIREIEERDTVPYVE